MFAVCSQKHGPFSPCGRRWQPADLIGGLTDEGSHRSFRLAMRLPPAAACATPHPTSLRSATFSRKGRRGESAMTLC